MGPAEREVTKNLVGWLSKYDGIPLLPFSLASTTGNFCSGLTNKESLLLIYCTNSSGVARTEVFDPAAIFKAAGISNLGEKWQITWTDPKTLQPKNTTEFVVGTAEHLTAPAFAVDLVSEWRLER
jgi:hypothetical protein